MKKRKRQVKRKSSKSGRAVVLNICLFLVVVIVIPLILEIKISDTLPVRTKSLEQRQKINLIESKNLDGLLMIVSQNIPIEREYTPALASVKGFMVDYRVARDLENMLNKAVEEDITLWIISAYRDHNKQEELLDEKIAEYMAAGDKYHIAFDKAVEYVAAPGTSEHYTGLAVDFNSLEISFEDSKAFKWLSDNAHKYGFILRYPKTKMDMTNKGYEPWHYRYVGIEHATCIKESEYCLEEYIESL